MGTNVRGIILEGPDGAGKSSMANALSKWFMDVHGRESVVLANPGATNVGQKIRGISFGDGYEQITPLTERLLMLADHAQMLESEWDRLVELDEPIIVICDRYTPMSNLAYANAKQMNGDYHINLEMLDDVTRDLFSVNAKTGKPRQLFDIAFLMDVKPDHAYARLSMRAASDGEINYLDEKSDEFKSNVRTFYLEYKWFNGEYTKRRPYYINANHNFKDTFNEITMMISVLIEGGDF